MREVRAEMEARYGPPPDATVYLLEAARVRLECERMGIAQIDRPRIGGNLRPQRQGRSAGVAQVVPQLFLSRRVTQAEAVTK